MLRRNVSEELIATLSGNVAWQNLLADTSLFPEIRDGHVTIYHLGGALLRKLRLDHGGLTAELNPKYIPVQSSKPSVRVDWGAEGFAFAEEPAALRLGTATREVLGAYKEQMRLILKDFPEGAVVQSILVKPENCILDQEIAFQASGQSRDKIDLCHFDAALQKLVFVEVKRRDDPRLWNQEILSQLQSYGEQLRTHRTGILAAYRDVVSIKRRLGLGSRLGSIPSDGPSDLLEKPLLVIGDCSMDDVNAAKSRNADWLPLLTALPDVAAGLILAGNSGCRLTLSPGKQTFVF